MEEKIPSSIGATLALRGLLEFVTLITIVFGLAEVFGGAYGVIVGIGAALTAATIWGIFTVPDDASRGGGSPIPVRGPIRLVLELAIFGFGVWAGWAWLGPLLGGSMAFLIIVHYLSWPARIRWLLAN